MNDSLLLSGETYQAAKNLTQTIATLLGRRIPTFGLNPFSPSPCLRPEISHSIDSLLRYEDDLRNFSRQDDNCRVWQVIFNLA
jgi:hypothetical protein